MIPTVLKPPYALAKRCIRHLFPPTPLAAQSFADREFDVRGDLIDFTRLPGNVVDTLLRRRNNLTFCDEWADTPTVLRHDHWFYLTSRFYLFANAVHRDASGCGLLDDSVIQSIVPPQGAILDYAGGTGNSALITAKLGYRSYYRELSAVQADFLRFRAWKYHLDVQVVSWWLPLPTEFFDLVCFDSIGHVVDQRATLLELVAGVKPGGSLFLSLDDFAVAGLPSSDQTRWSRFGRSEQRMHIANQVGDLSAFLETQGLSWVGPHWRKG